MWRFIARAWPRSAKAQVSKEWPGRSSSGCAVTAQRRCLGKPSALPGGDWRNERGILWRSAFRDRAVPAPVGARSIGSRFEAIQLSSFVPWSAAVSDTVVLTPIVHDSPMCQFIDPDAWILAFHAGEQRRLRACLFVRHAVMTLNDSWQTAHAVRRSRWKRAGKPDALLAAIVDASEDAIISKDIEGHITGWNKAAEKMFGYKPQEALASRSLSSFPRSGYTKRKRYSHASEGRTGGACGDAAAAQGWAVGRCVAHGLSGARRTGGCRLALECDARHQRKRSSELRGLSAIVGSSDDAIISKDLESIITSWNAGAEKMFGYTAAEAVGRPIWMLFPPERIAEETEILAKIRAATASIILKRCECGRTGV